MLDETKIEELKSKHGELVFIEVAGADFYFAKGPKGSAERYLDRTLGDATNGQTKREAVVELACASLVHPDQQSFREALSDEPLLIGNELFETLAGLYGMGKPRRRGKL